jgi:hypothetical protein
MEFESILKRFAPMILFDTNERYYPSTLEYYLANSESNDNNISDTTLDQMIQLISTNQGSFVLKNPTCKYGFCTVSDLTKTPLYVKFKEDENSHAWILTYYLFFPGQGNVEYTWWQLWWWCYSWCMDTTTTTTSSTPNIQSIHMIIDKTSFKLRELRLNDKHQMLREIEYYNDRLVLYSALDTHELSINGDNGCFQQSDGKGFTLSPRFMELLDDDS